ncbi:MAG: DJ-1/PfpI family protein [Patescibacteria group bacterium]|jgi:protease I
MDSEKKVVMVVPNYEFRDEEFSVPYEMLSDNGIGIKIAAAEPGECTGIGGTTIGVDLTFDEVNPDEFDGIVYVGGNGVERYFADDLALGLAQEFASTGKYVCAICWAPVVLAKAGILSGHNVAAWSGAREAIDEVGAKFSGNDVVTDGNIITASSSEVATDFARAIVDSLLFADVKTANEQPQEQL